MRKETTRLAEPVGRLEKTDYPEWGSWVEVLYESVLRSRVAQHPLTREFSDRFRYRTMSERYFNSRVFGRVIGVTCRYEGSLLDSYGGAPAVFKPLRAVYLFRVAVSWRRIIEVVPAGTIPTYPRKFGHGSAVEGRSEEDRAERRAEMESRPRDSKGRWKSA